ncbi:hypothetical protein sphantq_04803 (plasmid) [Sphingobium sp. AntQ-1]|nr:hypothetical protein sphantq_04803 [Sphingobium sp. AntQ-1]
MCRQEPRRQTNIERHSARERFQIIEIDRASRDRSPDRGGVEKLGIAPSGRKDAPAFVVTHRHKGLSAATDHARERVQALDFRGDHIGPQRIEGRFKIVPRHGFLIALRQQPPDVRQVAPFGLRDRRHMQNQSFQQLAGAFVPMGVAAIARDDQGITDGSGNIDRGLVVLVDQIKRVECSAQLVGHIGHPERIDHHHAMIGELHPPSCRFRRVLSLGIEDDTASRP